MNIKKSAIAQSAEFQTHTVVDHFIFYTIRKQMKFISKRK